MKARVALGFALLAATSALACSTLLGADFDRGASGDDGGGATANGDGRGDDGSGGAGGTGGTGDGTSDFDADGVTVAGYVFLDRYSSDAVRMLWTAGADFTAYVPSAVAQSCTTVASDGACVVSRCSQPTQSIVTGKPTYLSAGTIIISGAAEPITLLPGGDGTYQTAVSDAGLWTAGQALTAVGSGASVPPFSVAITTPPDIVFSAPVDDANDSFAHARGDDLELDWTATGATGADALDVSVSGDGVYSDAGAVGRVYSYTIATCSFQAAANVGSIPGSVWKNFAAADVTLGSSQETFAHVHVENAVIGFAVLQSAHVEGSLSAYTVHVKLQ